MAGRSGAPPRGSELTAVLARRLANQGLAAPLRGGPADLVRHLGAVQAQDYPGSLWALGLRLRGASRAGVEAAIASGALVRTWPMRGTLHYVPAEDVRWMLRLLTPRVIARSAGRYRQLELDEVAFARARRILSRALRDGRRLTRRAAYSALEAGGVRAAGQRGIH
ncbi:MAG TPA: crosslink repair DNA glycosylase YcaQ family protein, partial [Vicinamibacteria bacterium]|nr:crosslink repair DNA glycosylase YcaQ family protein [Vicinamibacteria bacterium]